MSEERGTCCYCKDECNICSQACGRCARQLTDFGIVSNQSPEIIKILYKGFSVSEKTFRKALSFDHSHIHNYSIEELAEMFGAFIVVE